VLSHLELEVLVEPTVLQGCQVVIRSVQERRIGIDSGRNLNNFQRKEWS